MGHLGSILVSIVFYNCPRCVLSVLKMMDTKVPLMLNQKILIYDTLAVFCP